MTRFSLMLVVAVIAAATATAANVDYQGAGGNLNTPASWYLISDPSKPASRTGVTRLPDYGDYALIRNSTTGTINFTLNTMQLLVGGPEITGVATKPVTTTYITDGATITARRRTSPIDPDEGRIVIGAFYDGALNMSGGSIHIQGALSSELILSENSGATGTFNMSGGLINIANVGAGAYFTGAEGDGRIAVFNMSGGTILANNTPSPSRTVRFGVGGGQAEVTLSGGRLYNGAMTEIGGGPDTSRGRLTQTGGSMECGYRFLIGEDSGYGHYRLLGGTLVAGGGMWLGRFKSAETEPGAFMGRGKMTLGQNAVITGTSGIWMGISPTGEARSPDHTAMELKIGSDADFNNTLTNVDLTGQLEVSFINGYTPAPGTDWRLFSTTAGAAVDFQQISAGFRTEVRGNGLDVYVICDAVRHPGDANNDGSVNVGDLGILAANWNQPDFFGKSWETGDFTGDDVVNVGDLGVLAANWGWTGAPAASVPEPASLVLLGLGALAMLRRSRR